MVGLSGRRRCIWAPDSALIGTAVDCLFEFARVSGPLKGDVDSPESRLRDPRLLALRFSRHYFVNKLPVDSELVVACSLQSSQSHHWVKSQSEVFPA